MNFVYLRYGYTLRKGKIMEQNKFFKWLGNEKLNILSQLLILVNVTLYSILVTILYPSSAKIIQGLGVSLNINSIIALSICNYIEKYWILLVLILLFVSLMNLYVYQFSNTTKIIILNISLCLLAYLMFGLSIPLLSHN